MYLDEVIVYSDTLEEHFDHLDAGLCFLRDAEMTLKLPKCHFFKMSVDYIGHIVTPGRLEVAKRATEAVEKELPPRNASELQSFFGLCNVYRRFVPKFFRLAKAFNLKLWKDQPVKWGDLTDDEMLPFKNLKSRLINPPVLAIPKAVQRCTLDTDACDYQVGCVQLREQEEETSPKPIGYWSRSLSNAQQNYNDNGERLSFNSLGSPYRATVPRRSSVDNQDGSRIA